MTRESISIVFVGHVDHGKSTLIGRIFNDTGMLPAGKVDAIRATCERRGMPFEWAFLMDALQAERDQGVTIDAAHIRLRTKRRDYLIIDAPGHKEFLKNMVTGAAGAEVAVLVIDAAEGVREQSRRHGYLLRLLGIKSITVAINKMDLVDYGAERFGEVAKEIRAYLASIDVEPTYIVPVSGNAGENIVSASPKMEWYQGPNLMEALDRFTATSPARDLPLRMALQDVYKFDARRIFAGRIETGQLRVGDTVLFSPANRKARVASLESWNTPVPKSVAEAGESVGFTVEDQIFAERGEVVSHVEQPPVETNVFRAHVFWLGREPLEVGKDNKLRLNTAELPVRVQAVEKVIDTHDLSPQKSDRVERNGVAEIVLRGTKIFAVDEFTNNPQTGRFVLVDGYDIAGGGIVSMRGYPDQRRIIEVRSTNISAVEYRVTPDGRAERNGHCGGVLWFTGLSGAGKSTLAVEVEQKLFRKGYHVYVLDGDNVRRGLNANLGFSPEDRAENIRRVGEVAALFAHAGFIVITAFISPYRSDRDRARGATRDFDNIDFHEVYIEADLKTCETRDPKGLYKRARRGDIKEFTGISAPYEAPESPELLVSSGEADVDACTDRILEYIEQHFALKAV